MNPDITRTGNEIIVRGTALGDFRGLLSHLHRAITEHDFSDIVLNFKHCTSALQSSMLFLCAKILAYREQGTEFSLIVPENKALHKLFRNTHWGHYLDPKQFAPSMFRGYSQIPATQYHDSSGQKSAVDNIVSVILGVMPGLSRSGLAALEWSINAITDNVLVHARSPVGGLVQVSTFQRFSRQVQFVVADAGDGIPHTLREGQPTLSGICGIYAAI